MSLHSKDEIIKNFTYICPVILGNNGVLLAYQRSGQYYSATGDALSLKDVLKLVGDDVAREYDGDGDGSDVSPTGRAFCAIANMLSSGDKSFEMFLKAEFSDENLHFWRVVNEMKNNESPLKQKTMLLEIYENYIKRGGSYELNISHKDRTLLEEHFATLNEMEWPPASVFDPVQKNIFQLLDRDTFPRFVLVRERELKAQQEADKSKRKRRFGSARGKSSSALKTHSRSSSSAKKEDSLSRSSNSVANQLTRARSSSSSSDKKSIISTGRERGRTNSLGARPTSLRKSPRSVGSPSVTRKRSPRGASNSPIVGRKRSPRGLLASNELVVDEQSGSSYSGRFDFAMANGNWKRATEIGLLSLQDVSPESVMYNDCLFNLFCAAFAQREVYVALGFMQQLLERMEEKVEMNLVESFVRRAASTLFFKLYEIDKSLTKEEYLKRANNDPTRHTKAEWKQQGLKQIALAVEAAKTASNSSDELTRCLLRQAYSEAKYGDSKQAREIIDNTDQTSMSAECRLDSFRAEAEIHLSQKATHLGLVFAKGCLDIALESMQGFESANRLESAHNLVCRCSVDNEEEMYANLNALCACLKSQSHPSPSRALRQFLEPLQRAPKEFKYCEWAKKLLVHELV